MTEVSSRSFTLDLSQEILFPKFHGWLRRNETSHVGNPHSYDSCPLATFIQYHLEPNFPVGKFRAGASPYMVVVAIDDGKHEYGESLYEFPLPMYLQRFIQYVDNVSTDKKCSLLGRQVLILLRQAALAP